SYDLETFPVDVETPAGARLELSVTPRVFVSHQDFRRDGADLVARVWVRNTLENTVNAFVAVDSAGFHQERTVTVPPGVTQSVEIRGRWPEGVTKAALT